MQPLHLVVFKDFDKEGNAMQVKQIPNAYLPHGATVYLPRAATPELRVKYGCALPFVTCNTFSDFVAQK